MAAIRLGLVVAAVLVALAACQYPVDPHYAPVRRDRDGVACGIEPKLVPSCGAWLGVAPNPLDGETWDEALRRHERAIGRTVNIVHYYHRAGQLFPTPREIARSTERGSPRLLFLNYKPAGGHTWREVAQGATNAELDRLAAYIRTHVRTPFFFTVHHEPEDEVRPWPGSGYTAQDYRAMYRHVVHRLERDGVTTMVRVMNYNGLPHWGSRSWFTDLYPGDDVVDWIAYDSYVFGAGEYWGGPADLLNRRFERHPDWPGFYAWASVHAPDKPLMVAEWGVAEKPGNPHAKAEFFDRLAAEITRWPRIKALVYWDSAGNRTVGATRVDSSPAALAAYRRLARLPYFNP